MDHRIAKAYVQYNPELKIITCIQHKYAIIPGNDSSGRSNVTHHFQEVHKPGLSKHAITPINEYISTLELLKPCQINTPLREDGPVDGLELYENGGQCLICHEFAISPGAMSLHFIKKHHLIAKLGTNWRKQAIQTIFSGKHSKYMPDFTYINHRYFPVDIKMDIPDY